MFVNIRCRIYSLYRNNHYKEKNRIDGMPFTIQWNIFPGITRGHSNNHVHMHGWDEVK